jgi:GNAT superfamily N-acetyltransferase
MHIKVRPLEPSDHADWLALFRDYVAFYGADVPADVVDLTWSRLMGEDAAMLGLGATSGDGRLVGMALVVFHRSTWSATGYCYLEDLYVAPAARGRGVGRALIEAVYAAADARGATRTYWVTEDDNAIARRLYDGMAQRAPFVQYRRR